MRLAFHARPDLRWRSLESAPAKQRLGYLKRGPGQIGAWLKRLIEQETMRNMAGSRKSAGRTRAENKSPSQRNPAGDAGFGRKAELVFLGITAIVAIYAAATSTLNARSDNRVDINVESQGQYIATGGGHPIDLGILNKGRRSVQLVSGVITVNGRRRRIDEVATDSLSQKRTQFPLTIASESSRRLRVFWTDSIVATDRGPFADAVDDPLKELEAGTVQADPRPPVSTRLRVRLHFDPGGTRVVTIPVGKGDPVEVPADDDPAVIGGWKILGRATSSGAISDFRIEASDGGGLEAGVAVLKLWTARSSRPVFEVHRPVVALAARFDLPTLRAGRYEWLLTIGGHVIGSDWFRIPCTLGGRRARVIQLSACGSAEERDGSGLSIGDPQYSRPRTK
jgi:hypothetical protein